MASDVHFGPVRSDRERDFLAWLGHAADAASRIILNGDLFDFWFEYRSGTTRGHERALSLLKHIVDGAVPITLVGGNHDWWGGRYLRDEIGVEFLQEPVVRNLAGRRTFLAHGDGLGKGDGGYRLLKAILRGRVTRLAYGSLPPWLGDGLARGVSRTGHKWDEWGEHQEKRSAALRTWAEARLRSDQELDLIVLGHTHRPLLLEVGVGRWYVNTGDWVAHRSFVTLEEGRPPQLLEWDGGPL